MAGDQQQETLSLYSKLTDFHEDEANDRNQNKLILQTLIRICKKPHASAIERKDGLVNSPNGALEVMNELGMSKELWICSNCAPQHDFTFLAAMNPSENDHDAVFDDLLVAKDHLGKGRCKGHKKAKGPHTMADDHEREKDLLVPFSYVVYRWYRQILNAYKGRQPNDDGEDEEETEEEEELGSDELDTFINQTSTLTKYHSKFLKAIAKRPTCAPKKEKGEKEDTCRETEHGDDPFCAKEKGAPTKKEKRRQPTTKQQNLGKRVKSSH